jgi:hypothetical protein
MNASRDGINAEHIYPRSKGAKEENGNAFSDLHNLAPARWEVNEARANFPFADINDIETQCWFSKNQKLTSTSSLSLATIDDYAEVKTDRESFTGAFEPREAVKGDIARSVFYFYTMYREDALRADPQYFNSMKETLCRWHNADSIDSLEMSRNMAKAALQDGQPNPFILDCSLANRLYCTNYSALPCDQFTTATTEITLETKSKIAPVIKISPNPNNGTFVLDISSIEPGPYRMDIYFSSGQLMYSIEDEFDYFNSINMWNAKNGMHYIHMVDMDSGRKYSGTFIIAR